MRIAILFFILLLPLIQPAEASEEKAKELTLKMLKAAKAGNCEVIGEHLNVSKSELRKADLKNAEDVLKVAGVCDRVAKLAKAGKVKGLKTETRTKERPTDGGVEKVRFFLVKFAVADKRALFVFTESAGIYYLIDID